MASCASLTEVPSAESKWAFFGSWTIPTLISISDLIGAFASGMTIKFIYLFFGKPYVQQLLLPCCCIRCTVHISGRTECFSGHTPLVLDILHWYLVHVQLNRITIARLKGLEWCAAAEEVGLSPIAASSISVASPLCINLASLVLQKTSTWYDLQSHNSQLLLKMKCEQPVCPAWYPLSSQVFSLHSLAA